MSRDLFGMPTAAQLKDVPVARLQEGYRRLTQPVTRPSPPSPAPDPEADVRDFPGGETVDPRTGEVFEAGQEPLSQVVGVGEMREPSEAAQLDDETATEALLTQLARYAESRGLTPAWLGIMQPYEGMRLDDGALVLTGPERDALYHQAMELWPEMTESDVTLF